MKKIISKIMLFLFIFSITLSGLNNNVHADANKHRIYGNDRIQTSIKISQDGWANGADTAIIAQGYGYADALCAGPLAKKHNAPIILSEKNGLNAEIINELKRLKVKKVFIIGGSGVLSESVERQLSNTGIKSVERLWGKDRYETSVKVAESLGTVENIVITSANGYADSLSIAPIAAQKGMPILLSEKDKLADVTQNYIKKMNVKKCYVVGGTGVISDNVKKFVTDSERLDGKDRFETNLAVLQRFQNELKFENIFIAQGDGPTGSEFADALSGSALAAQKSSPVILIYKTIYDKTAEFIKTKMSKDSKLIALGGTEVVPNDILDAVIDLFNGKTPTNGIGTPTQGSSQGGGTSTSTSKDSFTLTVTKNNGSQNIMTKTLNVDSNKNSMDYLKSVAKVTELQGPGFINGIDGLLNVFTKDLSISERKAGLLGKDWFICINGKLTKTGAIGVHPKAGDTLNFDYHEWDWHALMAPNYTGKIPLKLEDVPDVSTIGATIKLRATCVYRGIYDVSVKLDGQEVATTDIDGYASIKISNSGTHKIKVEKDGGFSEKTINVSSGGGPGGETPSKDDLNLSLANEVYDGNSNGNKNHIKGNVFIYSHDISLKNVNVDGELIIHPGVDASSDITNVTANKITIKSGGDKSIHFNNVKSESLLVDSSSNVRVEAREDTQIKNTEVVRSSILEPTKSSFGHITVIDNDKNEQNTLELRGDFTDKINVKSNAKLIASTEKPIPLIVINSDSKVQVTLQGNFENVKVEKEVAISMENNTHISKVEASANFDIQSKDKEVNIDLIQKAKNVQIKGNIDNIKVEEKDIKPDEPKEDKDTFKLVVSKDNGNTILKNSQLKVEKDKNSMDYLKSVANVTELQGPGFINGIDGLLNIFTKDLSISERKAGLLGKDWFIYLNGSLTSTGVTGVHPKVGDTLNFDYHEWDWHSLMAPGYSGTIPLRIEDVPDSINAGDSMNLKVTCVYRGVYGVSVKVDGQEVAITDIDGYASIRISNSGIHKIRAEKDGGFSEKTINVLSGEQKPPIKEDIKLVNITDKINLTITKMSIGTIKIEGNSKSDKDYITIVLYDEKGNINYINQAYNGKMNFNTVLSSGKYHGFVKASSADIIEINEFEVK